MINRVVLVGRLTRDPILRRTPSGTNVASFTVACDRRVKSEGQPTADFINCVCWGRVAENTCNYTHKGSLVGVEGRIQTRSYDDQNGRRVYVTEVNADSVQFLEPKGSSRPQPQTNDYGFAGGYPQEDMQQPSSSNVTDFSNDFNSSAGLDIASDDLPF